MHCSSGALTQASRSATRSAIAELARNLMRGGVDAMVQNGEEVVIKARPDLGVFIYRGLAIGKTGDRFSLHAELAPKGDMVIDGLRVNATETIVIEANMIKPYKCGFS